MRNPAKLSNIETSNETIKQLVDLEYMTLYHNGSYFFVG